MGIVDRQMDFLLLIPCYDDLEGLVLSLNSVAYYPDKFEVVVVDDGSAIPLTIDGIKATANLDYSIIILRNEKNEGITSALNKGLDWIERNRMVKYIARLDCGDLCHPDRFFKQIDYMNKYSDTALLGSWCRFQDKNASIQYTYKTPVHHEQIRRAMHIRNVFIHPTVMFKASVLKRVRHYPVEFEFAEDYAFFWELIKLGPSHILSEFLVTCAITHKGISLKNRGRQLDARARIIAEYGTNFFLKAAGILRTKVLHIVPKPLALRLKKLAGL
jgi:glycosyltransferase involved in cell wall biosynthesis